MNTIAPLRFRPIYKAKVWGGNRIASLKGERLPNHVGESWEISPMAGNESVVADGPLAGLTLTELMTRHGREILGERIYSKYGGRFPLLIKFLDSTEPSSIQVHPSDCDAELGKTEMWYCIEPGPRAYLHCGFIRPVSPEELRMRIADCSVGDLVRRLIPRAGDSVLIPAGRIHSMGPDNLVLEVQQASDTTYRLYDFDRIDADGAKRELHVDRALEVLDYADTSAVLNHCFPEPGCPATVEVSDYFDTSLLILDAQKYRKEEADTCLIVTVINGEARVNGVVALGGQTLLVPVGPVELSGSATLFLTSPR